MLPNVMKALIVSWIMKVAELGYVFHLAQVRQNDYPSARDHNSPCIIGTRLPSTKCWRF